MLWKKKIFTCGNSNIRKVLKPQYLIYIWQWDQSHHSMLGSCYFSCSPRCFSLPYSGKQTTSWINLGHAIVRKLDVETALDQASGRCFASAGYSFEQVWQFYTIQLNTTMPWCFNKILSKYKYKKANIQNLKQISQLIWNTKREWWLLSFIFSIFSSDILFSTHLQT